MGWSTPEETDSKYFHCPANLILNGEQWTRSSMEAEKNIAPFYTIELVDRGGIEYPVFDGCVSAAKNGLIITGAIK